MYDSSCTFYHSTVGMILRVVMVEVFLLVVCTCIMHHTLCLISTAITDVYFNVDIWLLFSSHLSLLMFIWLGIFSDSCTWIMWIVHSAFQKWSRLTFSTIFWHLWFCTTISYLSACRSHWSSSNLFRPSSSTGSVLSCWICCYFKSHLLCNFTGQFRFITY